MITITEVLALSHTLQTWRPDVLTIEFWDKFPVSEFCRECADWHLSAETHSMTY